MNFKMKTLVVALALTASAGANAAIDTGSTGNGSLVLSVLDSADNTSVAFDLGSLMSTFNSGVSQSWNLASNANYSAGWSVLSGDTNFASSVWGVQAADNSGSGVGGKNLLTTVAGPGTGTFSSTMLTTGLASFSNTYLAAQASNATINGLAYITTTGTASTAYAGGATAYGTTNKFAAQTGSPFIAGALGGTFAFENFASQSSGLTAAGITVLPGTFSLASNGILTYTVAAVPEADTWMMMMAGLGLMGFIARRRNAA